MASASTSRETNEQISNGLRCCNCWLSVSGVFSHTSEFIKMHKWDSIAARSAEQDLRSRHSPLEARCILLLSPGCLLAPPPDHIQDAGPPVTHDGVTNVTAPRSHSHHHHRHSAAISLSLYIMTSQCHITQGPGCHHCQLSELTPSRLLSPVAGDRLPTAGPWSAEPWPGREKRWAPVSSVLRSSVGPGHASVSRVPVSPWSYQETFK